MPTPRRHRPYFASLLIAILFALPIAAQLQPERVDLDAVARIRQEGIERSQVMEIAGYLTDVHGPRLTGSPNIRAAAEWAAATLRGWGLENVDLETWGTFGRGWTNDRFYAAMVAPYSYPLIGQPKAWTPGTDGPVRGEVVSAIVNTQADVERYRGQLRGKFVLTMPPRELAAWFDPVATRYTDEQLETLSNPPQRGGGGRGQPQAAPPQGAGGQRGQQNLTAQQRIQFFRQEGVLAMLEHGSASGGNILVQGGGEQAANAPAVPAQIVLAAEHYGLLFRNVARNVPVMLELDVQNTFHDDHLDAFNVIGELPGTDKADEIVMLGAHFDSWHAGTGATDNAAGVAVMMEAMRILQATGLPLRRTVRIGLWTGEEQGLLGSRAYVAEHFAVRQSMQLKPLHSKFSVYFNVDNGTGQIRGVYTEGNDASRGLFEAWMEPFREFGMTTLSVRGTGGTDHTNFDAVGLPGFQFIQDPIEYDTRTHHTSMDTYERLQATDMRRNAVIVAAFAYHAAVRDELFPRKPLPAPPPGQRGGQ